MTTTTAPWTEAEVRQAIEARIVQLFGGHPFSIDDNPVYEILAPVLDSDEARASGGWNDSFSPPEDHPGTLWADMRPSEIADLKDPIDQLISESELAYIARLIDDVVPLVMKFAAAHPDVPRGHWSPAAER